MSLLEENKTKAKSSSLKSDGSKTSSSSSAATNLEETSAKSKQKKKPDARPKYQRSVSEQDSFSQEIEDDDEQTISKSKMYDSKSNELIDEIQKLTEIPPADVQVLKATPNQAIPTAPNQAIPTAPPLVSYDIEEEEDVHEMETLLVRNQTEDVDDVADVQPRSVVSNYSEASTLLVRSPASPEAAISDLLSMDTQSDNVLFPALIADPPRHPFRGSPLGLNIPLSGSPGSDVDACPDFGLGAIPRGAADWVIFDGDEMLQPPPAPSMDHIRQLLRYELPVPHGSRGVGGGVSSHDLPTLPPPTWNRNNTGVSTGTGTTDNNNSRDQTAVKVPYREHGEARCLWTDTAKELVEAECEAEILYKMVG